MKLILLTAVITFFCVSAEKVRYDNHAVYRFTPNNENELKILQTLQKLNKYNFWTEPRRSGLPVDVMVPPESKDDIENLISEHQLTFKIMMEDVQKQIEEEKLLNAKKSKYFDWESYHTLEEIYDWLKDLAARFPKEVTLVKGGTTYEGRDILGVKVSYSPDNANKTVWIDSLIHAREWIAGATSTYILNKVLTSTDRFIRKMAESHDWYFFPVINPDGYEYTHTTDRLWRKTRKPYSICIGTDPNRNWGYRWNEDGGSSDNPCADDYAGPNAFSEVETSTLSQFMSGVAKDIMLFYTFHSYSQLILLPYGHTTEHLDNYDDAYQVAMEAASSLEEVHGTKYTVGNIAETIYVATGSNMDWLKANYHVPYAYAYELRDTGNYGFLLPADQIIPTGEETLDSIMTALVEIENVIE